MCALLHNGTRPFLGLSLGGHGSKDAPGAPQYKTFSRNGSLPTRLARFVGKPAAALERLIEDFQANLGEDAALAKAADERKTLLRLQLRSTTTLQDWQAAASELDELEGNNEWKQDVRSPEYNSSLVELRLRQLEDARIAGDAPRMLFLIRTALSRHLGGMSNIRLYKHSHVGTKELIERYIGTALETLSSLLDLTKHQQHAGLDNRVLLEQVLAARQSFGRSALLLSGGGTFGMSHAGVVKCLWEQQLLPRIVSGASAGSIVCAVLCARTDEEIPQTLDEFCHGDLDVFTSAAGNDGLLAQTARFLKTGAFFDISNLTRVMRGLVGDMTFQEAYNRTRRILNITVSSASVFELPRLLNYVTAPNVLIWSAVAASCSVPVVFTPASLLAKDPRTGAISPWNPSPQRWIDGSVDNDLPMTRLAEMFNVNHFIVSQVNPHVVPFLAREEYEIAKEARASESAFASGPSWLSSIANMAKVEALHRMHVTAELGIFPNLLSKTRSILNQKYSGDITILPEVSYSQFPKVLQNPTTEFMLQSMLHGERATWPKLSRIQNHCAIELALDDAVQHLRARIAFSPSQVDLRLHTMPRPLSRAGSDGRRPRDGRSQRKRLRFSGEKTGEGNKANSSRPVSLHDRSPVALGSARKSTPVKPMQRRAAPTNLNIDQPRSSPIFTTGSEADSDDSDDPSAGSETESDVSEHSFEPTSAQGIPLDRRSWPDPQKLFPHASQPATPSYHNRHGSSYFNSTTPPAQPVMPMIAHNPSVSLSMTPSMNRQSTTKLGEDFRRKKNAGATPGNVTPVGSNEHLSATFNASPVEFRSGDTTPRSSLEQGRPSNERTRSSLDFDVSEARDTSRRKKNTSLHRGICRVMHGGGDP